MAMDRVLAHPRAMRPPRRGFARGTSTSPSARPSSRRLGTREVREPAQKRRDGRTRAGAADAEGGRLSPPRPAGVLGQVRRAAGGAGGAVRVSTSNRITGEQGEPLAPLDGTGAGPAAWRGPIAEAFKQYKYC